MALEQEGGGMNAPYRLCKLFVRLVLVALAVSGLSGCAGLLPASWKEEVLLHDGRTIVVNRWQSYGGRREIGQSPPIREHTVTFSLPGSRRNISWTSEYGEELGRTNFNLLAIHVLKDTPYIVASPNLCLSYNKWGRPNPPYVFFRLTGDEWARISLEEFPAEFTTINVAHYIGGREPELMLGADPIPAAKIQELNHQARQPEYRSILREALPETALCPDWNSQRYRSPKAPHPIEPKQVPK